MAMHHAIVITIQRRRFQRQRARPWELCLAVLSISIAGAGVDRGVDAPRPMRRSGIDPILGAVRVHRGPLGFHPGAVQYGGGPARGGPDKRADPCGAHGLLGRIQEEATL